MGGGCGCLWLCALWCSPLPRTTTPRKRTSGERPWAPIRMPVHSQPPPPATEPRASAPGHGPRTTDRADHRRNDGTAHSVGIGTPQTATPSVALGGRHSSSYSSTSLSCLIYGDRNCCVFFQAGFFLLLVLQCHRYPRSVENDGNVVHRSLRNDLWVSRRLHTQTVETEVGLLNETPIRVGIEIPCERWVGSVWAILSSPPYIQYTPYKPAPFACWIPSCSFRSRRSQQYRLFFCVVFS